MKDNVLVTGGAGFIGSHIVDKLIEKKYNVIIIDDLSTGNRCNINKKAIFYNGSITNKTLVKVVFSVNKPKYVFHCAAKISVSESLKNPIETNDVNINGSINILECCKKYKCKKIIFSSTGGAMYGEYATIPTTEFNKEDPISPYAISKLCIEKYLKYYSEIYNLDYAILRYSNVYGERQNSKSEAGVVSIFIDRLLENKYININGDGKQKRDFIHVSDIVNANLMLMNKKTKHKIFNVSSSFMTSINDLLNILLKISDKKPLVFYKNKIKGEQFLSCLDNTLIKHIKWKNKVDLFTGLKLTYDFFKKEKEKL